ncbi:hypothetical protein DICVIV_06480 [Dictyocaulus viviparus]|uniref:Uncharacterized protein n=1 Tax=Dictyocaulus viviparus TaxID=29172 RepID=A0A0D8XUL0_DICVI|nr:hypothetical protein DICVIV_06480 [Dictyocaulus viviparus]
MFKPCSSREQNNTNVDDEIVSVYSKKSFIVPSKSQVLFYLSTSRHFRIHNTGCELQNVVYYAVHSRGLNQQSFTPAPTKWPDEIIPDKGERREKKHNIIVKHISRVAFCKVTDSADFPLFDIWAESTCCGRPVWVVESYVVSELRQTFVINSNCDGG